ncbi:hypothetical protein T4B_7094 [Trichinella pseudospiralis]|uniref:Uncharacterized protein n=2 Tax=Trichinella pseudospiralis TaxID=6337 RepID=A0A0V1FN57_TRIPS|nr:hypothetical protein T4A_12335 [Trichinella pseudospiralis]KRY87446.1 hypothetical protein T4D_4796 [Trichinella pseudospiralis]KRZ19503.1 hypothetical protein T4B_7094 [Trichinella pseudospiralis]KRZ29612.1 hypothetical protein T4C_4027 [Trichinella pseudospiralis]
MVIAAGKHLLKIKSTERACFTFKAVQREVQAAKYAQDSKGSCTRIWDGQLKMDVKRQLDN